MTKENSIRAIALMYLASLCACSAFAQEDEQTELESYLDTWLIANSKAHVEIYETENEGIYAGKVVWHVDPDQQDKIGEDMVENLQYDIKGKKLSEGRIDMEGKSAKCEMVLKGTDQLEVTIRRGPIKKKVIWSRVEKGDEA